MSVASYITLAVRDIDSQIAFYQDALSLPLVKRSDNPEHAFAFFSLGSCILALYPSVLLEHVSGQAELMRGSGSISLSMNVENQDRVDELLASAISGGGQVIKSAQQPPWGGYCGFIKDPEDFVWEIVWHPNFAFPSI